MDFLEEDMQRALAALRSGGMILYPTDTVWGIGCDATDQEAVAGVFRLKRRLESKSLIVLVADKRDILRYTAAPDPGIFGFLETTEKPTTVIYEGGVGLAKNLLAEDGSVGIRIVADAFCRHLIKRLRKPIVSTSANVSGEPAPKKYSEISDAIKEGVDYVVRYRQEDETDRGPSSVVRWTRGGHAEILRP